MVPVGRTPPGTPTATRPPVRRWGPTNEAGTSAPASFSGTGPAKNQTAREVGREENPARLVCFWTGTGKWWGLWGGPGNSGHFQAPVGAAVISQGRQPLDRRAQH